MTAQSTQTGHKILQEDISLFQQGSPCPSIHVFLNTRMLGQQGINSLSWLQEFLGVVSPKTITYSEESVHCLVCTSFHSLLSLWAKLIIDALPSLFFLPAKSAKHFRLPAVECTARERGWVYQGEIECLLREWNLCRYQILSDCLSEIYCSVPGTGARDKSIYLLRSLAKFRSQLFKCCHGWIQFSFSQMFPLLQTRQGLNFFCMDYRCVRFILNLDNPNSQLIRSSLEIIILSLM